MATFTTMNQYQALKQNDSKQIFEENVEYLNLYEGISVPSRVAARVIVLLDNLKTSTVIAVAKLLSRSDEEQIVLIQYIFAMMYRDEIEFDPYNKLDPGTKIWR